MTQIEHTLTSTNKHNLENLRFKTKGIAKTNINYKETRNNIHAKIYDINTMQKTFVLRKKAESSALHRGIFTFNKHIQNALGNNNYGEWSHLFQTQLDNVKNLNTYLRDLINASTNQSTRIRLQIAESINQAKNNAQKKEIINTDLPELKIAYEQKRIFLESLDKNNPGYYDALNEEFLARDAYMKEMQELGLVQSIYKNDDSKVEFLRRHYSVHQGLIFSAQDLAVKTHHMCGSLEQLIEITTIIDPMTECLEGVHNGVKTLGDYTHNLNESYKKTFSLIEKIETYDKPTIYETGIEQVGQSANDYLGSLETRIN
ncbi:MAG: hypothetical protein ACMXYK_05960 [Candidatus Woesearchaeota archaeon]